MVNSSSICSRFGGIVTVLYCILMIACGDPTLGEGDFGAPGPDTEFMYETMCTGEEVRPCTCDDGSSGEERC